MARFHVRAETNDKFFKNPPGTPVPAAEVKKRAFGCWYCGSDEDPMLFSTEFDCYLHMMCLQSSMKEADPQDRETPIIAAELNVSIEPEAERKWWA